MRIAIADGAAPERVFDIEEQDEIVVGRGAECAVRINDLESSRHHARIRVEDGVAWLEDLGSKNGTLLNGSRITRAALRAGDQITIGAAKLAVGGLRPKGEPVTLLEVEDPPSEVMVTLQHAEADIVTGRAAAASIQNMQHENETLRELCRISQIAASNHSTQSTLETVLDRLHDLLHADAACLLVWSPEANDWQVRASSTATPAGGVVTVSRTIMQEAVSQGVAVLSTNPRDDGRFNPSLSIVAQGISSAVCSPFKLGDKFGGVLFLDRRNRREAFTPLDLRLTASAANILGLLLEKVQYEEESHRKARLAVIGEVVAHLAHYIKNVVTGFKITIAALQMAWSKKKYDYVEKCLTSIADQERRISNLMLNMLTYAKDRTPVKSKVDLRSLAEEVVGPYRHALEEKHYEFEFRSEIQEPLVFAEALAIYRVFLNFLLNAMDALGARGDAEGPLKITMTATPLPESGMMEIRFRDTGCGIAAEHKQKIFAAFFSTKGSGGTGLGLAVVHKIITEHGGTIDVDSEVGAWTEFVVRLPLPPDDTPVLIAPDEPASTES